jgi:hypothetical protein
MATACAIHYSLHPGMVIRYLKGKYVGENRNVNQILSDVSPVIDKTDAAHIKRILTQGCPSKLSFEETMIMKASIIQKGNQATFNMHPEAVTKTMNKEDRHSHLLPVKLWILHFSPWCRHTAQGMQIKPGKNPHVIFDASTKSHPHEIVLNDMTTTEFEAIITFGASKLKLLQRIYNWRITNPNSKIYIALGDVTACFRFPRCHADLTGAFGFMVEKRTSSQRVWSLDLMLLPAVGNHSTGLSKLSSLNIRRGLILYRSTKISLTCSSGKMKILTWETLFGWLHAL